MVPRENKNNPYAKFGGTNKEYYGIFRSGLFIVSKIPTPGDHCPSIKYVQRVEFPTALRMSKSQPMCALRSQIPWVARPPSWGKPLIGALSSCNKFVFVF